MFDNLSSSFEKAWSKLSGARQLTKENMKEPLKDIRRALLEADVSLPVVRRFIKRIEDRAVGTNVIKGVRPDQQLVKFVSDELLELMGTEMAPLEVAPRGPTVILMAGLQGVGKTTACGKLALFLKKQNKSVMMIATDTYRPAAIDQLKQLGDRVGVDVFEMGTQLKPAEIARRGLAEAKKKKIDFVIVDTSGRLQVDAKLMGELKDTKRVCKPQETLLVVDAMTGQEAANLVKSFNDDIGITGAVLTKLDGDTRGGAALTIREVSGRPIKFVGVGEKMEALEPFYPDRMANRILGMGDVLSLVEKAEEAIDAEEAERLMKRIDEATFDYEDFLKQTQMISNMGSFSKMAKMMPGMGKITGAQLAEAERKAKQTEAMIMSMTPSERKQPDLLATTPSRRKRIAKGSGHTEAEVSNLVAQFSAMRTQMQNMSKLMQLGQDGGLGDEEAMKKMLEQKGKVKKGYAKRKKAAKSMPKARGFGAKVNA